MIRNPIIAFFCLLTFQVMAQRTAVDSDPRRRWDQAAQWFYEGKESLAYPVFLQLHQGQRASTQPLIDPSEADYFRLACGVRLDEKLAVEEASRYVMRIHPAAYIHSLSYYLADHHFRAQRFTEAQQRMEQVDGRNLREGEQIHYRFMMGYTHFIAQRFDPALRFFDSVRTKVKHPDYAAANYYYGFLCLRARRYEEALSSLQLVEKHPEYRSIVPYYIGQLYYLQGKKSEAIEYVERKLSDSTSQYYEWPLKQLLGHAYFEKRAFDKALPLLKEYVAKSEKVRREDIYELSYCYHQSGQYAASIPGFRELGGGQDSLSQHAMYLLGDAYLKTGDLNSARNAFQFCARNNSYRDQREISLLQYAKLSYELSFLTEAQISLEQFLSDYPRSVSKGEAQELMVMVLSATNNFRQAEQWVARIDQPSIGLKKSFPRIWFGRAMELVNDQLPVQAQELLNKVMQDPNAGNWKQQAKFWSGEIAYRQNDHASAVSFLLDFLSTPLASSGEVNAINARYTLGYAYLKSANYASAGDQFQLITKSLTSQPSALLQDAWLRAGDCFYMRRDFTKSKPYYDRAITQQWPAADYAQFQVAMIAGIRNIGEKIKLLQVIPDKYPQSVLLPDTYLEMANAYMADRKFLEAIPVLDRVIATAKQESWISRALLMQGICQYNLDAYEEALARLKEVVKRYPDGEEADDAIDNIRQVYVKMGKSADFVNYMNAIGKPLENPVADSLTFVTAAHLYEDGKDADALIALQTYLTEYPNGQHRLKAFYLTSQLQVDKKDWSGALSSMDSVLAKQPNVYEEWCLREAARISYFERKDPATALRYYGGLYKMTRNQPFRMEALRGSVRCYHMMKDWAGGIQAARSLLNERDATPDDRSIAQMLIAQQALEQKNWNESLEAFKNILVSNRGSHAAEARYQISWIQFQQNKYAEAEKAAEETIRRSGSFEPWATKSYILLGDIYAQQKDFFNAKATYQSVVDNATDPALQNEAKEKLQRVVELERKSTKLDS
ncbi:MAG: tetratricopeptide repeat protein [Bacteroidota bacterium]